MESSFFFPSFLPDSLDFVRFEGRESEAGRGDLDAWAAAGLSFRFNELIMEESGGWLGAIEERSLVEVCSSTCSSCASQPNIHATEWIYLKLPTLEIFWRVLTPSVQCGDCDNDKGGAEAVWVDGNYRLRITHYTLVL